MDKIQIFVAFDHHLLRDAVRDLIAEQPDMDVAGEGSSLPEILEKVLPLDPHIVITDGLWPAPNGITLINQIHHRCSHTRVLVVTMGDDVVLIRRMLECGASGCLGRHATSSDILAALRQIHHGHIFVDPKLAGNVVQEVLGCRGPTYNGPKISSGRPLSQREAEVLEFLVKGYTNQQVADSLFLSVKTAETYRARLKRKLGLRNRSDIVQYGIEMGILGSREQGKTGHATFPRSEAG